MSTQNQTNKSDRLALLDKDTGEEIHGAKLIFFPKKVKIKEAWFMAMSSGFESVSKMPLRGESLRVLMYCMSQMDFENHFRHSQTAVCEALGMRKQNVSRAVRELKANGVFNEAETGGLSLNPEIGWRGGVRNLRKKQGAEMKEMIRPSKNPDASAAA